MIEDRAFKDGGTEDAQVWDQSRPLTADRMAMSARALPVTPAADASAGG
jgi:hypothetical protein